MENSEMTKWDLRTVLEMVVTILETSETKEEAIEKIKSLSIMKE
ncbi:MAG: hypothetical protein Q4A32_01030 [Lachnospiraceae bacterium]|nr:hypothetical protein [Lachnospiraceae bacterium]